MILHSSEGSDSFVYSMMEIFSQDKIFAHLSQTAKSLTAKSLPMKLLAIDRAPHVKAIVLVRYVNDLLLLF